MTEIILIRHGESMGNLVNSFLGHTDLDLSPKGYKQAELLRKHFENIDIDLIFSSDLKRAYNTVKPISEMKDIPIITSKNLREIHAGEWENKHFDELETIFEKEYDIWKNNIGLAKCTGGESVEHLQKRVYEEITKIAKENDGKKICIGTHATPIRSFAAKCDGVSLGELKNYPWAFNASLSVYEFSNDKFVQKEYNYIEHLEDMITSLPKNV
ncbi:MAG: histidine phosphatase family protein [Clostridia bacterium]|nr:histidine phosphatase family protein [Clostridia bacterium]